ncbi:amino acid ABC transporter substrate-binding protein [Baekduia soli]|uniref:Amino acid ABC transporter substrate-binding protein n=1 Tax=Baekduia soli TaxID=496014 RepID=A0A5B8U923_9ACTN|nr:ABC transporter substrate-binding protein [Baekduia soli]QEC49278.1 amino acid ABC transporter substrate-binding protein [Baekduia soli]
MGDSHKLDVSGVVGAQTRRRFVARTAAAGSMVAAGGVLAACGSSKKSSGSDVSSTVGSGSKPKPAAAGSATGQELQKILGKPTNLLAKGPGTFKIAGQFAISGAGSVYGLQQTAGFKYGAQHVAEWTNNKVQFDTKYYDNKSGVPQAEAAAGRQAGLSKVPVLISSYIFGFGAIVPFAKQYKMFTPDPGGGAGPIPGPFAPQPYCYGFRAGYPTDCLDGIFKYLSETFPSKKKYVLVQPVIAPPYNNAVSDYTKKLYSQYGVQKAGELLAPLGATDYSSTIQKVKQLNPDVVIWTTFGTDPAYQAKEMLRQGVKCINAGVDHTSVVTKLAGAAWKDWYFGFDYLDVNGPSPWTKFFVENWKKDHNGETPNYYNAGDYITAFAVATLMERILAAGGDINNGDDYVKALEADPSFPHVYGGTATEVGKIVIDPKTHSPSALTMQLFQDKGTGNVADITPLATYGIKAADFQKV